METIESELRQFFATVVWNHKIHEKQSDIYTFKFNFFENTKIFCLTLTTSGLLSSFFTDELWIKIVATIVSAINIFINSYYKTYNLKELKDSHKKTALKFLSLRNRLISIFSDIHCNFLKLDEVRELRNEIYREYNDICEAALPTSNKAVKQASVALSIKRDNTFLDDEINSYLPIELRKEERK